MQVPRTMQDPPGLNFTREFAIENQITPKTFNTPRADFGKSQIITRASNARIAGEKFKCIISSFQKKSCCKRIVVMNKPGHCLQVAEDKLTFVPAWVHFSVDRILEMFPRSPGENFPLAASANFSRMFGGVSFCSCFASSCHSLKQRATSARSSSVNLGIAALISATVLIFKS